MTTLSFLVFLQDPPEPKRQFLAEPMILYLAEGLGSDDVSSSDQQNSPYSGICFINLLI